MSHGDKSLTENLFKNLDIRLPAVAVPAGLKTKPLIPVLLRLARQTF
jgi:hypothetical protein